MRTYSWWLVAAVVVLGVVMALTGSLSWASLGNNLLVGLICAILTATVFTWVIDRERRRTDGLWVSEVIFLQMIDVQMLVLQGARWLLENDPPGIEASEKWMPVAEALAKKRETLGAILPREMLIAVVELENELRRVDFVTARGDESRKAYAVDLLSLWRRYHGLMDRMLPPKDELRKDLLVYPLELRKLQDKYNLTEHGIDRDEDAEMRAAFKK